MKHPFVEEIRHRFQITKVILLLLVFVIFSISLLYLFLTTAFASRLQQTSPFVLQTTLQTIAVASPTATSSTPPNTSSQVQSENNIASLTITVAGVFVGAIVLMLTATAIIAGILGFREFHSIKESRVKLQSDIKKAEDEIDEFKTRLQQLSKSFEDESQVFMEASYQFSQGKIMYKEGDDEQAIAYYLEALKLRPNNSRVFERLGRAYSNLDGPKNREMAIHYLNEALKFDEKNEAALRGLGLCYRDTDPETAYAYFHKCSGYEALDFLGLLYRDQRRYQEAVEAHNKSLEVHKETFGSKSRPRPETLFYLSILFAHEGKMDEAKKMAAAANNAIEDPEHLFRLRRVWLILIRSCYFIIFDNRGEALDYLERASSYITSKRIYDGVYAHLDILLEATGHIEWKNKLLSVVKLQKIHRI